MQQYFNDIISKIDTDLFYQFDIAYTSNKYIKIERQLDNIQSCQCLESGFSVRVIDKNNRYAQVSLSSESDIESLPFMLNKAIMHASTYEYKQLYSQENNEIKEVIGIYNHELEVINKETHEKIFDEIVYKISNKSVHLKNGNYIYALQEIWYYNPICKLQNYKSNGITLNIVMGIKGYKTDEESIYIFQDHYMNIIQLNPNKVHKEIYFHIEPYINRRSVALKDMSYDVVFSPPFFYYLFNKYYINDFYHTKKVDYLMSNKLTLLDDGLKAYGFGSKPFDSEGNMTKLTTLVKNGVKIGSLVPMIQAAKYGLKPTGNMSKLNYWSKPKVNFNNLVFDIEDKVDSYNNYIYINTAGTGEYTNVFSSTFNIFIKNGEKIPLKPFYFEINFKRLFSNITALKKENEVCGMYFPDIIFKNIKIIST